MTRRTSHIAARYAHTMAGGYARRIDLIGPEFVGAAKDRQLRVEFDDPFEALRRSNQLSRTNQKENTMPKPKTQTWLPGMDSNHDSRLQRPLSYH